MKLRRCALALAGCLVAPCFALDANTATEAELDSVRGIGPPTTRRILAERDKAPFTGWADFMQRVKGIRAPTASRYAAQGFTVNGQAFEAPAPTPTQTGDQPTP